MREITRRAPELKAIKRIVAFGSRVRGDFRGDSDLDLLVLLDDIESRHAAVHLLYEIELQYDVPLAPTIRSVHEWEINVKMKSPFVDNVNREGVVLYDSERTGKN